jgi:hypothetical protein
LDGVLPAVDNVYEDASGSVRLAVCGGMTAAVARVEIANSDSKPHRYVLRCDSGSWGENPAWLDWTQYVGDNLVAGWNERADRCTLEAAEILGKTGDFAELRKIYETANTDLLAAMDRGAIREKSGRWIPGVPGKTSGSCWGVLNAAFPCALLPCDHELITGTLRKIESNISRRRGCRRQVSLFDAEPRHAAVHLV